MKSRSTVRRPNLFGNGQVLFCLNDVTPTQQLAQSSFFVCRDADADNAGMLFPFEKDGPRGWFEGRGDRLTLCGPGF